MIRLEHMQEFVALAERLSFTDASAELYVAQPSLSRHVAGMEAELGVKLLNRSTRQVQLTPAGETMYAAFNRILRVYRDAADLARVYGAGWEGRLRIGSPRFLAEEFMEDRALEFTRRYPEVKLELRTFQPERSQAAVLEGEIDLTVCLHTDLPERGLCLLPFDREPLNAVLSADHPLAGEAQLSLSQLSRERFIFLAGEDGCSPRHFERFLSPLLEERGVKPDQILHLARFDDFGITIRRHPADGCREHPAAPDREHRTGTALLPAPDGPGMQHPPLLLLAGRGQESSDPRLLRPGRRRAGPYTAGNHLLTLLFTLCKLWLFTSCKQGGISMPDLSMGLIETRFAELVWDREPITTGELTALC